MSEVAEQVEPQTTLSPSVMSATEPSTPRASTPSGKSREWIGVLPQPDTPLSGAKKTNPLGSLASQTHKTLLEMLLSACSSLTDAHQMLKGVHGSPLVWNGFEQAVSEVVEKTDELIERFPDMQKMLNERFGDLK